MVGLLPEGPRCCIVDPINKQRRSIPLGFRMRLSVVSEMSNNFLMRARNRSP